jgi:hypothetical protein
MIERLDPLEILQVRERQQEEHRKLFVNLRVGQFLVLRQPDGRCIHVVLEGKHGSGARLAVRAHDSVQIIMP